MPWKHYGDLGLETDIDTCLNSTGLGNKPCAFWIFLSSEESGELMPIPSWHYSPPFFT